MYKKFKVESGGSWGGEENIDQEMIRLGTTRGEGPKNDFPMGHCTLKRKLISDEKFTIDQTDQTIKL